MVPYLLQNVHPEERLQHDLYQITYFKPMAHSARSTNKNSLIWTEHI